MKRIAILIGSPMRLTQYYLQGVEKDLINMRNFLKSATGGSWKESEIFMPKLDPSFLDIQSHLENCKTSDFAFVYFSGHGFTDSNNKARINLNQAEKMLVDDLVNLCNKQITIIDACRVYIKSPYGFMSGIDETNTMSFNNTNLGYTRSFFDKYLQVCKNGSVLIQATQQGEVAREDFKREYGGGYFSTNLLEVVNQFEKKSQESNELILNIHDCFNQAYEKTKDEHIPELEVNYPSALKFPFAINSNYKPITDKHSNIKNGEILAFFLIFGGIIGFGVLINELLKGNAEN